MTTAITRITINEYKCERCDYKWVNRRNGKDRPIPRKCAKCKRDNWDGPKYFPKKIKKPYKIFETTISEFTRQINR